MISNIRKISLIIAGLVAGLLHFSPALATTPAKDITVAPFLQTIQIQPTDQQKSFSLKVTNNTSVQQTYKLSTVDFGGLDETGGVLFEGSSSNVLLKKYGLAKWITLSNDQVTLNGSQSQNVEGQISNDSSLKPGGHYGAIIITSLSPGSSGTSQVGVNQQVSALIFATKIGGEKYDLHLDTMTSNKTIFKLPSKVSLRFKNTGNTQLVPRGIVYLKSGSKVLARGVINEQSGYILPETYRVFDVNLRTISSNTPLAMGSYTLQADYRYDGYDSFASKSQTFRVANPTLVIGLALLSIAGVAAYAASRRALVRPRTKRKPSDRK